MIKKMQGKWLLILLSILFFTPSPSAEAARFSGEYLLYICSSDELGKEKAEGAHIACQSYISGVIDYHNLIQSLGTAPSVKFCVPAEVPLGHLQNIVYNYFYKNRHEHSKFVASPGVALALHEAYPCK